MFVRHPNPNASDPIAEELSGATRVTVLRPMTYPEFTELMAASDVMVSDSGGVQEEAPHLGVPVLVLRSETGRPEAVAAGTAKIVGCDPAMILSGLSRALDSAAWRKHVLKVGSPFGDGQASSRVMGAIKYGLP